MYKDKKVLAVVPARGGSKGVPLKNIYPLGGRPLIEWVGDIIREVPFIDRAIVSTDSKLIADAAQKAGLEFPFFRPESLSGDRIADWDVLAHCLIDFESLTKTEYDIIVMLQPTCPLRKPSHVIDSIVKVVDEERDAVWTMSETDSKGHPLKQFELENGNLKYYDENGKKIIARQQLTPVYHRNGACYAITRQCLLEKKSIFGDNPGYVITEDLISIDTLRDFALTEWQLKNGL